MPQIQTEVHDGAALRAACRQLGLPEPVLGAFSLGSAVASGFAVLSLSMSPRKLSAAFCCRLISVATRPVSFSIAAMSARERS